MGIFSDLLSAFTGGDAAEDAEEERKKREEEEKAKADKDAAAAQKQRLGQRSGASMTRGRATSTLG